MRVYTRGDMDGLTSAVFLTIVEKVDKVLFAHPKDVQDGLVEMTEDGENAYVIDSDFSRSGRTEISDVNQLLSNYHHCASCLIQWCISPRLHNAMEPEEI